MYNIVFFDTETTGNTEKDFLCQIAYKNRNEVFTGLFKPEAKIPPEASAVHHITNKMVNDKPKFINSPAYKNIKNLFEDKSTIVIAHNAPFDLMMIKKEDIEPANFICTLRVARYLDPEGKIGKYNLQYLRYLLEIEVEANAHDALGDVLVLEKLFERQKNKIMNAEGLGEEEALKKMMEISSHPSLLVNFNFGKYNGRKVEEMAKLDPSYLEWLLAEKEKSDTIDEDWIYTLKYYLGKMI